MNLWPGAAPSGSRSGASPLDPAERAVLLFVIGLCVGGTLIVATGHLSALVFNGGWPRYPADAVPGVLGRAITSLTDPGSAWDEVNEGTATPGPVAWWLTFLVLLGAVAAAIVFGLRAGGLRREAAGMPATTLRDLRRLGLEQGGPDELAVGTADGHEVALKEHHSLLVIGPARSGKTSAVAIPAVLEWPGPVVATSTAGEVVDHTIGWRSRHGDVHVFDPTGATRYHASGWSPLATSGTWAGATRTAWDLAMAGKASAGSGSDVGDFWFGSAARSLAPYLLAAAESGLTMQDVARWIDAEERDEVLAELEHLERDAAAALTATFRREPAARSSVFHVMQQIVGGYLDPRIAASALRNEVEWSALLEGEPHTLYLVGPYHDQARVRPLFAAIVRQALTAVHDQVAHTHRPLHAPLLMVLDDAAGLAPVEDLAAVAATVATSGVQVVTVFQDLTQIETRHGPDAAAVIRNHRAKLLLPGVGGEAAGLAERLAGDAGEPALPRLALDPDLARRLPPGEAVLVYGDRGPVRVRLRHWFTDRNLRRRADAAQEAIAPADSRPHQPGRAMSALVKNMPPTSDGPILDPLPTPPPVDMTAFDDVDPETYLVPPHFPPNVSPLAAARDRLRRRKGQEADRQS